MARPTEYTPEIAKQAWDYLDNYEKHGDQIPSIVGLADALSRAESTVYAWDCPEKPEFSGILEAIKQRQQKVLLNKGLSGDFNSQITKLVLGKHGFHDVAKTDHTINDYSNMDPEARRRRLMELQQELNEAERG